MSDRVISLLRTFVPLLYGHLAAWLVGLGVPASLLDDNKALLAEGLAVVISVAWYALWRAVEPHLPKPLVALLLGHHGAPSYSLTSAVRDAKDAAEDLSLNDLDVEPAGVGSTKGN